ncbi:hypothetical protein GGI12_002524 [Dipsacomyces acuminosporus]|nr:hypothetical protein GGI12_002524 [Dipsacomyces acuminosporus]
MHTLSTLLVLTFTLFAGRVFSADTDLIKDASTIKDVSWYTAQVSSSWASVFYRVNMNINDAKYLSTGKDAYASATWLYGTTALPASVVPGWAAGYLDRAHELASKTAAPSQTHRTSPTPKPTATPATSRTPASTSEPASSERPESSATSATSSKSSSAPSNAHGPAGIAVLCAVIVAIFAVPGYY